MLTCCTAKAWNVTNLLKRKNGLCFYARVSSWIYRVLTEFDGFPRNLVRRLPRHVGKKFVWRFSVFRKRQPAMAFDVHTYIDKFLITKTAKNSPLWLIYRNAVFLFVRPNSIPEKFAGGNTVRFGFLDGCCLIYIDNLERNNFCRMVLVQSGCDFANERLGYD